MSTQKVLPITTPDLTSYAHLSYYLSILFTDKDALRWVYSNFIQLHVSHLHDGPMLDFYTQCPDVHLVPSLGGSPKLTRDLVKRLSPSFTEFVRESIEDGYYVNAYVDDYDIPGTVAYHNRSNPHGLMINGFNDDSRVFHVSAYLANQTYGNTLVGYDDMERAYQGIEPLPFHFTSYLQLYRLNEMYKPFYLFQVPWFIEQLEDYLHAKSSSRRMMAFEEARPIPHTWGTDVLDWLIRESERQLARELFLDHRPFYVLWEHKRMMNRRLSYMEQHGYFTFSSEVVTEYREVEQAAMLIRNLKLKHMMSSDDSHLKQLIARLKTLKSAESLVIERMLEEYERSLRMGDENGRRLENAT